MSERSQSPGGQERDSLAARTLDLCRRLRPLFPPGAAAHALDEIAESLEEPLRVAVAGRVNAGKSTLVNALLGQRVAPTDVTECTKHVTWYRFGVPERVEVVLRSGETRREALTPGGALPDRLQTSPEDVSHLRVFLGNDALRDRVVIDTPGLASVTPGRHEDTAELLALDVTSRLAVAKADAVLFVLPARTAATEDDALRAFATMTTGVAPSALNAIGVLSRADQLDDDDPLVAAGAVTKQLATSLRGTVGSVLPLVGLLGETACCGALNESAFAALVSISELDDSVLDRMMISADRFISSDVPVPRAMRAELLERLDLFGVARSVDLVRSGTRSPAGLVAELRRTSGIDDLRDVLARTFTQNADALKAAAAISAIERLAYSGVAGGPLRSRVLDEIEAVATDPSMHRLAELGAWLACERGETGFPVELCSEVSRLTGETNLLGRLGLAADASAAEATEVALAGVRRWKTVANDPRAEAGARAVADVIVRSYERLWMETTR